MSKDDKEKNSDKDKQCTDGNVRKEEVDEYLAKLCKEDERIQVEDKDKENHSGNDKRREPEQDKQYIDNNARREEQDGYLARLCNEEKERRHDEDKYKEFLEKQHGGEIKWKSSNRTRHESNLPLDRQDSKLKDMEASLDFRLAEVENRMRSIEAKADRNWRDSGARDDERDF